MANILLIEPNRLLARNYMTVLERAGHTVRHCGKGQAAIQEADQQTPDLVILELQLAGHNGVEFLYEFRSYIEWQHIPVVALSLVQEADVKKTRAFKLLNIQKYLYKSTTDLDTIVHTVDDILTAVAA